ncbi:MAG: T9SS type A sorting domain-containing protein [Bacteroidota bacterium]
MRRRDLLISLTLVFFIGSVVAMSILNHTPVKQYHPRNSVSENGIKGAVEWLAAIRNNKTTGEVNPMDILNARAEIASMMHTKSLGIQWQELGPNNVGGRTRAIMVDKDNHNLLFAGGVSGGLFKSATGGTSWVRISGFPELSIACIAQSPTTGYLYVGTGEYYANVDGTNFGTPGFIGSGLYESTDGGTSWHIFQNAAPSITNATATEWAFVNRIAFDANGRLYAGTNKGLQCWDQGGSAWVNPIFATGTVTDKRAVRSLSVGSDGTVVVNIGTDVMVSEGGTGNGNPHTFFDRNPASGIDRTEVAVAPSNPNYIYACSASGTGALVGVFRSTDKGLTWTLIGPPGGPAFNVFGDNNQGDYDNVIGVFPNNPNHVIVGGIDLWEWFNGGNFTQISASYELHVDLHCITFDRTNPNIYYIGCDGGIAKTIDGGGTFAHINKNYSVTQFYAVAMSNQGAVMGGTQDNSCPYVSRTGIDPKAADVLFGGDGGWAAFSYINPDAFFGTAQCASAWRSPDKAASYKVASTTDGKPEFFSAAMLSPATPAPGDFGYAPFVTPLVLWESVADIYNTDSILYKATTNLTAGDTIIAKSHNALFPFMHIMEDNLGIGDSVKIQDPVTSKYFICLASGIWMTREPLNFAVVPKWYKISSIANAQTITISKDGNYLFAGMTNGQVYRISNLLIANDSLSATYNSPYCVLEQKVIKSFSGQAVTSIGVDPNDANRLVVTLGNYGNDDYIYFSGDALASSPTFSSKQGTTTGKKLPKMPIYSCIIEMGNPNRVLLGTEYGIYATDNILAGPAQIEWTEENAGMDKVPVFMIRQQVYQIPGITNYGAIYLGTHGRGFFESTNYLGIDPNTNVAANISSTISIYPNPVSETANIAYTLTKTGDVSIDVYDITGKVVKSAKIGTSAKGNHTSSIDVSGLSRGTYIVGIVSGSERKTAKMIVTR